jgi:hypothetical protein
MFPDSPPVRPVLSTCQTGDGLSPCLLLIQLSCALLKDFFLMPRCLLNSRRWKLRIFARIELQRLMCHTQFYKENRIHLICVPGSIYTHMIDKRV